MRCGGSKWRLSPGMGRWKRHPRTGIWPTTDPLTECRTTGAGRWEHHCATARAAGQLRTATGSGTATSSGGGTACRPQRHASPEAHPLQESPRGRDLPLPRRAPCVRRLPDTGRAARERLPLFLHGEWTPSPQRRDLVKILQEEAGPRIPEPMPIRCNRMAGSLSPFYRGTPAVMAADLAGVPVSGLTVQLSGDAHLSSFGLFASPERRLLFDLDDFDEMLPGPFEWDVKRLAAGDAAGALPSSLRTCRCPSPTRGGVWRKASGCSRPRDIFLGWSTGPPSPALGHRGAESARRSRLRGRSPRRTARGTRAA